MLALKPVLIAIAATAAISFPLGLSVGYSVGISRYTELKDVLDKHQAKVTVVTETIKEVVYQDRVEYRDRVKLVDKELPFIVERPVYKNICLDEAGVKAFNTYMGAK